MRIVFQEKRENHLSRSWTDCRFAITHLDACELTRSAFAGDNATKAESTKKEGFVVVSSKKAVFFLCVDPIDHVASWIPGDLVRYVRESKMQGEDASRARPPLEEPPP
jgi:endonuclease YncB( thermonuclease family)